MIGVAEKQEFDNSSSLQKESPMGRKWSGGEYYLGLRYNPRIENIRWCTTVTLACVL